MASSGLFLLRCDPYLLLSGAAPFERQASLRAGAGCIRDRDAGCGRALSPNLQHGSRLDAARVHARSFSRDGLVYPIALCARMGARLASVGRLGANASRACARAGSTGACRARLSGIVLPVGLLDRRILRTYNLDGSQATGG